MLQNMLISSLVRTQTAVALSSAEAEFYAMVGGVIEGLYVQSILKFFGIATRLIVRSDSSSGRGFM